MATLPHVVVATHGHCFDGMCSAALFTELMRTLHGKELSFTYKACGYGPNQKGLDPALFGGSQNAILDFRYTATDRLTWYFDHHATAFATPEDRAYFDRASGTKRYYDPTYGSCTRLIHDISREHYGVPQRELIDELVRWADIIDTAAFSSAEMAVARSEPALWLMTVVENDADDAFLTRTIPLLLQRPLDEIARSPEIQARWSPLKASHEAFIERVRQRSVVMGPVVYVDLTDQLTEVVGKFVTYALYPKSMYSVMISRGRSRCKLSIGYNPWCGAPRGHDISQICSRHGGGGHAVVGAITLAGSDVERAKQIAQEVVRELSDDPAGDPREAATTLV